VYPRSRNYLFPPAPLALVDSKTGGLQKPRAGALGTSDSLTGAAEKHQGEAVEQEAHNFVTGLAAIGLSSATGKHPQDAPPSEGGTNDAVDAAVPDPTNIAIASADAKDSSAGGKPGHTHDKTKKHMDDAMWEKMRPTMHMIADLTDGWERFAK